MAKKPIDPDVAAAKLAASKAAQKIRGKRWYEANKEKQAARAKLKHEANPEERNAKQRARYHANPEAHKAALKRSHDKDRESYLARERARGKRQYEQDKKKRRAIQKKSDAKHAVRLRAKRAEYQAKNREALRIKGAEYRRRNPGRAKEWALKNPEKARASVQKKRARKANAEGNHTAADIKRIYKAQKGKCAYCPTSLKGGYHEDHIIPLSKGGSNHARNIQLLCQPCNQRKHAKDPVAFAQEIGLLV